MDKIDAKIILLLDGLELYKRNPYFIAGKLEIPFTSIYQRLRILKEMEYITMIKPAHSKKVFYNPTQEGIERAKGDIKDE